MRMHLPVPSACLAGLLLAVSGAHAVPVASANDDHAAAPLKLDHVRAHFLPDITPTTIPFGHHQTHIFYFFLEPSSPRSRTSINQARLINEEASIDRVGEALAFALDRPWWLPDRVLHWDRRAPRVIESADGSSAGAGMNGEGERQGNGRVRLPKLETGGYRLAKINVEKFVNGAKAARESRLARAADASRVASLRGSETEEQQRTSGLPPSPFDQARSETIDDMASAAETYHTIGSVTPSRSSTAATLRRMATRGARTASRAALSSMGIDLAPTVEYDESVVRVNEQGVPVVGGGFIPYEDADDIARYMAAYNKAHPKSPPIGSVFAIQVNLPASLTKLWRRDKAYKLKVKAAPGTRSGYRWFDPRRLFPMQRTLGASNFVGIDVTGKGGDVKGRGVMGWVECAMCVAQDTARDMQYWHDTYKKARAVTKTGGAK